MTPQAICFITSGSRGNKLAYYDRGESSKGEAIDNHISYCSGYSVCSLVSMSIL